MRKTFAIRVVAKALEEQGFSSRSADAKADVANDLRAEALF
jgi:hypothetical protein